MRARICCGILVISAAFTVALLAGASGLAEEPAPAQGATRRPPPEPPRDPPDGRYVGAETCRRCHYRSSRTWETTPHARAHEILPARYRADASCAVCHDTGSGREGGFVSLEATPRLAGVQCEACHGPGAAHAELARSLEKKLDEPGTQALLRAGHIDVGGACIRCHVAQGHRRHPDYLRDDGSAGHTGAAPPTATARGATRDPRATHERDEGRARERDEPVPPSSTAAPAGAKGTWRAR